MSYCLFIRLLLILKYAWYNAIGRVKIWISIRLFLREYPGPGPYCSQYRPRLISSLRKPCVAGALTRTFLRKYKSNCFHTNLTKEANNMSQRLTGSQSYRKPCQALPGNLGIKRHSPSYVFYLCHNNRSQRDTIGKVRQNSRIEPSLRCMQDFTRKSSFLLARTGVNSMSVKPY